MATIDIKYRLPTDTSGGLISELSDADIQRAIAARLAGNDVSISAKGGKAGNFTIGTESLTTEQANAVLDYMIQNNLPATSAGLAAAQLPSGVYHQSRGNLEGLMATGAAGAILAPAGLSALAEFAPGLGLSTSSGGSVGGLGTAGSVSPEFAASMMGESVPTMGGFIPAGISSTGLTAAEIASAMEIPSGTLSTLGGAGSTASGAGGILSNLGGISGNTLGSLVSGGASILSGEMGSSAAKDALGETQRQFNINQQNMQPWLTAGTKALGAQQDLMGLGAGGPEAELSSLMSSPGYQFRKQQGEKSLAASTAARGGMGSGKAMTGAVQYGQEFASNEYGNRLNQLAGLSGTGQTQASNIATLGQNYASEAGNASLSASQARQSGILGAGQALSGYLNPLPKQKTLADLLAGR